jgi:hypothetical protein
MVLSQPQMDENWADPSQKKVEPFEEQLYGPGATEVETPEAPEQQPVEQMPSREEVEAYAEEMAELRRKELVTEQDKKSFLKFIKELPHGRYGKWIRVGIAAMILATGKPAKPQDVESGARETQAAIAGINAKSGEIQPEEKFPELRVKRGPSVNVDINKHEIEIPGYTIPGQDRLVESPRSVYESSQSVLIKSQWSPKFKAAEVAQAEKEKMKSEIQAEIQRVMEQNNLSQEDIQSIVIHVDGRVSFEGDIVKNQRLQQERETKAAAAAEEVAQGIGYTDARVEDSGDDEIGAYIDGFWVDREDLIDLFIQNFDLKSEKELWKMIRQYNKGQLDTSGFTAEQQGLLKQALDDSRGATIEVEIVAQAQELDVVEGEDIKVPSSSISVPVPSVTVDPGEYEVVPPQPKPEPKPTPSPTPVPPVAVEHEQQPAILEEFHGVQDPQNYGEHPKKRKIKDDRPPIIDPPIEKPPVDPPVVDPPIEKPPVDPPVVDPPIEKPPVDPPVVDPPIEKPPVDPTVVDPPIEKPPVDPPVIDPPIEKPPVDPPVVDPPIEQPPIIDPPIDNPPPPPEEEDDDDVIVDPPPPPPEPRATAGSLNQQTQSMKATVLTKGPKVTGKFEQIKEPKKSDYRASVDEELPQHTGTGRLRSSEGESEHRSKKGWKLRRKRERQGVRSAKETSLEE